MPTTYGSDIVLYVAVKPNRIPTRRTQRLMYKAKTLETQLFLAIKNYRSTLRKKINSKMYYRTQ